jgi:hypothetical protein
MAGLEGAGWVSNEFSVATRGAVPGTTQFRPGNRSVEKFIDWIEEWIAQLG